MFSLSYPLRSGNRPIVPVILLSLLSLASCAVFQGTDASSGDQRTVVLEPEKDNSSKSQPAEPAEKPKATADTLQAPSGRDHFDRFRVAILLPFSLDQRSLDQLSDQNPLKKNRPVVSLGFLEGAMMAADSLRRFGQGMDIWVYDTRNSAEEVRRILAKPELEKADLILGPVFEQELQEAITFARQRSIPIVSPLRKVSGVQHHAGLYAINPGETEMMRLLGAHLYPAERRTNIVLLRQDKAEESERCAAFQLGAATQSGLTTPLPEWVGNYHFSGLAERLSTVSENILIVPSRDEVFVNSLCRKLISQFSNYRVRVYGLEDWKKFESIPPDHLVRINLHYPTHYYPGRKTGFRNAFEVGYKERYAAPPGEYAYYGYDLMLYFGRMLQVYGDRWPAAGKLPPKFPGMNDQFHFGEIMAPGEETTDYTGNKTLHLVRLTTDGVDVSP